MSILALAFIVLQESKPGPVSFPVHYHEMIVVISSKSGDQVAAFWFYNEFENGVNYKFRGLSADDEKSFSGEGKVFEEYEDAKKDGKRFLKGERYLKAGTIRCLWSVGPKGKGWLYYSPEDLVVQVCSARFFEELDLRRFLKRKESK